MVSHMQYIPKTKQLFNHLLISIVVGCCLLFLTGKVWAVGRGYKTADTGLQTGMAVSLSLESSSSDTVERASLDNSDKVVGVVTTIDKSLVTVSSSSANVLVESEGEVESYVSDVNGSVKKGDLLVLSPLKGIFMKGGDGSTSTVFALAANNPTAPSNYSYVEDGKTKQTSISKIRVNLNQSGARNKGVVITDSALARLGKSIVGKDVGEIRVVIAMIIFFIVLIAEGAILYGAISSAMTALGRNPLAKRIIRAELIRVVIIALVVLSLGLAAVYGILWI